MSPDFPARLLTGVARYLAASGCGTWSPTVPYDEYTRPGPVIVLGELPQGPDQVHALALYGVSDHPSLSDSVIGLQVTSRAVTMSYASTPYLGSYADPYLALHGATNVELVPDEGDPVTMVQAQRQSWSGMGMDANQRWRTVQNFYLTVHRPTPFRE